MKKGYIILSGSVDGATCEDDGFINCANFALASGIVHKTKEEAIEIRDQIIKQDLEDFKSIWDKEDRYSLDVGSMNEQEPIADRYIDVCYKGEVINETVYKIQEVEYE